MSLPSVLELLRYFTAVGEGVVSHIMMEEVEVRYLVVNKLVAIKLLECRAACSLPEPNTWGGLAYAAILGKRLMGMLLIWRTEVSARSGGCVVA